MGHRRGVGNRWCQRCPAEWMRLPPAPSQGAAGADISDVPRGIVAVWENRWCQRCSAEIMRLPTAPSQGAAGADVPRGIAAVWEVGLRLPRVFPARICPPRNQPALSARAFAAAADAHTYLVADLQAHKAAAACLFC